MKMRDYQRSKVYTWCNHIDDRYHKRISQSEVSELIAHVLNDYGYNKPYAIIAHPVKKRFDKDKYKSKYSFVGKCDYGQAVVINIHPEMRTVGVVLHEVAHMLVQGQKHTDKFVGMLIELYSYYMGIDELLLLGMAFGFGVYWDFEGLPKRQKNSRKFLYRLAS